METLPEEVDHNGDFIVRSDCPSDTHNSYYAARNHPQCICPRAHRLRERRREQRKENDQHKRPGSQGSPVTKLPPPISVVDLALRGVAYARLVAYQDAPRPCRDEGWDPELWFPISAGSNDLAKSVCARCPAREDCAQAALDNGFTGIWGGTDDEERDSQRRQTKAG